MSLPRTDAQGRIYAAAAGTPVSWNEGLGYTASGQLCTTATASASDAWNGGLRRSANGSLVVAAQGGTLNYNGGWPCNASDGAVARQVDVVPAVTDPYVGGVRIGPTGGVYMTTTAPA